MNAGKSVSKLTEEASDELGSIKKGLKADEVKGKGYKSASDYADKAQARLAESKAKYGSGKYGGEGYGKYQGDLMDRGSKHSFDELKEMAGKKLDFSTPRDSAVFWSGKNMTKAQSWAEANGKFTLEQTVGGRYLDKLNLFDKGSGLTGKQASEIWDIASNRFSRQASGVVHTFSTGATKMNAYDSIRTWWRIEKPNLINNPEVTNIFRMKIDGTKSKTGHWSP